MVVGANSTPVGNPILKCGKRNFIRCKTAPLWYSMVINTAWLWGSPGTRLPSSWTALLCSTGLLCSALVCLALLWWDIFIQHSEGNLVFNPLWKEKAGSQSQQGAGLYGQKLLPLIPDWSVFMQMRTLNPSSLISPKETSLIGQNGTALIYQWGCWWRI